MEELESGEVEFESVEEFFTSLKKEFGGGEEEAVKAAELRKMEQGGRTMEEFVQEFKRATRGSGYEERPLVEEFKRGMNGGIRRKLMEAENPPASIEQWYRRAVALLSHCSMEAGGVSASINFLLIPPFIPRLNSSTNGLPL